MLTWIFGILMLIVFGRILLFALSATWSIAKVIFALIFLPLALVALVFNGLILIAFPVLIIIGLLTVFGVFER